MKEMARYGFILALICVIAAGLLGGVNVLTRDKIANQAKTEEQIALREVMPLADRFSEVKSKTNNELLYYQAFDRQNKLIGLVFKASGKGYSSTIQTLVGIFPDDQISAIKIISQNETPGLGVRVTEDKFRSQFNHQNSLELSGISAITGATISSRAVMNSIMKKAAEIKELIKNEK